MFSQFVWFALLFNSISNMRVIKVSSTSHMVVCHPQCESVTATVSVFSLVHSSICLLTVLPSLSFSFSNFNSEKLNTSLILNIKYSIYERYGVCFCYICLDSSIGMGGWGKVLFSVFFFFLCCCFSRERKNEVESGRKWFQ